MKKEQNLPSGNKLRVLTTEGTNQDYMGTQLCLQNKSRLKNKEHKFIVR
jgi:hypothetical protein